MNDDALRLQLTQLMAWHDAHADFEAAIAEVPLELRGQRPHGMPYSLWQLVEHLRLAQQDILDFCVNPDYEELTWPDDYWPAEPEPPEGAWDAAIHGYREDLQALQELAQDRSTDLFATIPHGSGQTYLREFLLVADHAAYHVGQIVLLRRLLGNWGA